MLRLFTGMCAASIHRKELPLHVEEADVGAAAERGVHQPAALAGELRGRAYEPPRAAFRVPLVISGARSHKETAKWAAFLMCRYYRAHFLPPPVWTNWSVGMFHISHRGRLGFATVGRAGWAAARPAPQSAIRDIIIIIIIITHTERSSAARARPLLIRALTSVTPNKQAAPTPFIKLTGLIYSLAATTALKTQPPELEQASCKQWPTCKGA